MTTVEQNAATLEMVYPAPPPRRLHCNPRSVSGGGARTSARIDDDVAEQGARRLSLLAILTAISVLLFVAARALLQPEMAAAYRAPLFRLSVLFLVLVSIGLAALQRYGNVRPERLLDLGLVYEAAGAVVFAVMENALPWANDPVRGSTIVAAWIALCVLTIPTQPWKSVAAALASVALLPVAHLVSANILGHAPLPWNRLASYSLCPFLVAACTPLIATHLRRLHKEVCRSQDLGSYHLQELLGRGGMGEVWRARHRLLRRDAAVKLVLPDLLAKARIGERQRLELRFEQEAQAIARLASPHTVSVFDFGVSEDGSLYYVMELLNGIDAERLVERFGPQPPARVISWLRQACDSLAEAHDLGMVHRDIKPSNIFLCRLGGQTDFVKLLDFGLVKLLRTSGDATLTIDDSTSGTPAFMSPEQVRNEGEVDARADIYGLGSVAYFLLTGELVFNRNSPLAMAIAQVEEEPEPPSRRSETPIPESLERIVMSCLRKDPAARPQSVAELAQMLDRSAVPLWTQEDSRRWWDLHMPEAGRSRPE